MASSPLASVPMRAATQAQGRAVRRGGRYDAWRRTTAPTPKRTWPWLMRIAHWPECRQVTPRRIAIGWSGNCARRRRRRASRPTTIRRDGRPLSNRRYQPRTGEPARVLDLDTDRTLESPITCLTRVRRNACRQHAGRRPDERSDATAARRCPCDWRPAVALRSKPPARTPVLAKPDRRSSPQRKATRTSNRFRRENFLVTGRGRAPGDTSAPGRPAGPAGALLPAAGLSHNGHVRRKGFPPASSTAHRASAPGRGVAAVAASWRL